MTEVAPEPTEVKAKTSKDVSYLLNSSILYSLRCRFQPMKWAMAQYRIEAAPTSSAASFSSPSW